MAANNSPPRQRQHVTALVPAAGFARRMGGTDKRTLMWQGKALLTHVVDLLYIGGVQDICVVCDSLTGTAATLTAHRREVRLVANPDRHNGLGQSIAQGAQNIAEDRAILIALADMPAIQPQTITALLTAAITMDKAAIIRPQHDGTPGHPVLFGPAHRAALTALKGDQGAKPVVAAQTHHVTNLPVGDPAILLDVDTKADLTALKQS